MLSPLLDENRMIIALESCAVFVIVSDVCYARTILLQ